ncbi:unnamed protein product, partial [Mesorhabditis belari]|uniref:m7GpppX diphosphatase n=1 Tax=Mesorhabditis belari TaxID=2138241 RepID=A0AAF3F1F9_9BILA
MEVEVRNEQRDAQEWMRSAKFVEILASDSTFKSLFILLQHSNGEEGILLMNKSSFQEEPDWISSLCSAASLKEISRNDIFGNYDLHIPPEFNVVTSQLIFPANEKLKAKYRSEEKFVIHETPEDYRTITLGYIEKYQLNLNWVYNVLNKEAEAERIIYEDPNPENGFILSPDIKWDGKTVETLYVLAIIHRKGVRSVRDLTANDLPLLENIKEKGLKTIEENYGLRRDQVRVYFHYQPSFFHLHVHFVNVRYLPAGSNVLSAIALDDVINNITLLPDFYQKATLTFTRKKSDKLLQMFVEAGRMSKIE